MARSRGKPYVRDPSAYHKKPGMGGRREVAVEVLNGLGAVSVCFRGKQMREIHRAGSSSDAVLSCAR